VVAHAQKPDVVFQRNGRVHFYRRGCQFSRLLAAEVCASAVVMLNRPCPIQGKAAGYPLHSPFSPSLLHPCVFVCHQIPFLLYHPLSCYSSVGIVLRPRSGRPRNLGSIAVRVKRCISYEKCVNRLWGVPQPRVVYRG